MEEIQMVNQKIQDRLAALRAVMKENGVDWYMVHSGFSQFGICGRLF